MTPAKTQHISPMSTASAGFVIEHDLPPRFADFYKPLHDAFTARQQWVIARRKAALKASLEGNRPNYNVFSHTLEGIANAVAAYRDSSMKNSRAYSTTRPTPTSPRFSAKRAGRAKR